MDKEYFIDCSENEYLFCDHDNIYRQWLNENIGRGNWQFYGPGSTHPNTIRFENREDAMAFSLKFDLRNFVSFD